MVINLPFVSNFLVPVTKDPLVTTLNIYKFSDAPERHRFESRLYVVVGKQYRTENTGHHHYIFIYFISLS